jgi:uncharacterized protein
MASTPRYQAGSRELQDAFDTRRLAHRLEEWLTREPFDDDDRAFIDAQPLFFLASADGDGWPDCSYKGGVPGFVQVTDARTLVCPSDDGNGMFRSLGNLNVNPRVGLRFIDFEQPRRLRVQGRAERIFPNCPRYIHPMRRLGLSPHAPRDGHVVPDAAWKRCDMFADVLPGCAAPQAPPADADAG